MRTPFIAGNWKMNKTVGEAIEFVNELKGMVQDVDDVEIGVFPPAVSAQSVCEALKGSNICVGIQNLHWEDAGAFTGELSAEMILSTGCTHVLIGHSERRQFFGETDETVNKKTIKALAKGLLPVVCVGESLEERESGTAKDVVRRQVTEGLKGLSEDDSKKIVIAYEPVWAIGTGKTATPETAQEMHAHIRNLFAEMFSQESADMLRIQYGGSVKPDNVKEIMGQTDIDGALVGGAALKTDSFTALIKFK